MAHAYKMKSVLQMLITFLMMSCVLAKCSVNFTEVAETQGVNIPLEQLAGRWYEYVFAGQELTQFDPWVAYDRQLFPRRYDTSSLTLADHYKIKHEDTECGALYGELRTTDTPGLYLTTFLRAHGSTLQEFVLALEFYPDSFFFAVGCTAALDDGMCYVENIVAWVYSRDRDLAADKSGPVRGFVRDMRNFCIRKKWVHVETNTDAWCEAEFSGCEAGDA